MNVDKSTILIILDGWGDAPIADDNAITVANTPNWDKLVADYPVTTINTSGRSVGLPAGQMGNSEVGHMSIGSGRVIYQSLTRIENELSEHQFEENLVLSAACESPALLSADNAMHIMGLVSAGGVHSHENHIEAMVNLAKKKGVKKIYLHAFTDGRDVAPTSAKSSLEKFEKLEDEQFSIATISGRYYAMDRDNNWDRVANVYNAIVENKSNFTATTSIDGLEQAYSRDENDEFVQATVLDKAQPMSDGDVLVFLNFRADRARELAQIFDDESFDEFPHKRVKLTKFVTMTQYQSEIKAEVAFAPELLVNSLGEVISNQNLKQLRIAETEKYAHVTYFFNGGEESVFTGEDRILIPSPDVKTYDLQPEMSAPEVTKHLVEAIQLEKYSFICVNYANTDMVGHTGVLSAAVEAVEAIDKLLLEVVNAAKSVGMDVLITADHGNVEQMINPKTGGVMTSHTVNPVPLVMVSECYDKLQSGGSLCDLAPTILELLKIEKPVEMTGKSLL